MAIVLVGAAAVLLVPDKPVTACGPDFPTNMIVRRADALETMWDGSFVEEAAKLVALSPADREAFSRRPEQMPASAREEAAYGKAAASFAAKDFAAAARGFRALLRLPPNERRRTSVAAAYSLGRALYAEWKDAEAVAAFRQVRALVRAGFGDRDNLARDSLGEEARIERERRGNLVAAVRLYAQQAALEGVGAELSLLFVARALTATDRAALYRDDVGTRLLALYFYTREFEIDEAERTKWQAELVKRVTTEARGAAYLAAAAYRNGEWAAAARLAGLCRHAPIATWVQAKLALRDGDRARADLLLREVERAGLVGNGPDSPVYNYSLDSDARSLVRGELGLVALADDRFADAADWFARGQRMMEASYVVERVMSIDELLSVVQATREARRNAPVVPAADDTADPCSAWEPIVGDHAVCWGRRVLEIYARRLVRMHRYDDALDAFASSAPAELAKEFTTEMKRADATSGIERAQHLYRASRVMRESGMEIAGTEVGPDWSMYEGNHELETLCMPSPTAGYTLFSTPDDDYHDPSEGCLSPMKRDADFVSALEAKRVTASAPEFDQRFAYRYVASRLAESAANLVPPGSQAYAQTMCFASLYARRDRTRANELYATYLRNGAGALDGQFGADCAEPDFGAARTFVAEQQQRRVERALEKARARSWTWPRIRAAVWRHKRWLLLPLLGAALVLLLRRRHGASLGAL